MFMFNIVAAFIAVGSVISQPIIPGYAPRYQLIYLTPSFQHVNQYRPKVAQPILHNRVSANEENIVDSIETNLEEEKLEVSQFHSEDAKGRIVYGFHSPDQIRMETRDADGSVRGSYSYIDPNGNVVRMQYWDDGSGFHAAGNNIPVAIHQAPEYTPEVKAARENHLRLYEAALAALQSAGDNQENDKDESGYIDTSHYEAGDEYEEHEDAPPEDGVIIENPAPPSSIYADSLLHQEYPKVHLSPTNQLSDSLSHQNVEDKESVSIENPEFRRKVWNRKGKSQGMPTPAIKQLNINERNQEEMVMSVSDNDEIQMKNDDGNMNTKLAAANGPMVKKMNDNSRAFFYHFTHTIPMPVERVENMDDSKKVMMQPSVSARAQQLGSIPVAAVHDAQVSPTQQGSISNYQLFPVYIPPAI